MFIRYATTALVNANGKPATRTINTDFISDIVFYEGSEDIQAKLRITMKSDRAIVEDGATAERLNTLLMVELGAVDSEKYYMK